MINARMNEAKAILAKFEAGLLNWFTLVNSLLRQIDETNVDEVMSLLPPDVRARLVEAVRKGYSFPSGYVVLGPGESAGPVPDASIAAVLSWIARSEGA